MENSRERFGKKKMNWLLIVVIAVLIINSLFGMKAGLIKTVFSLFSMIAAIALTVWLSPYVNDYMRGNDQIYSSISTKIEKVLPHIDNKQSQSQQVATIEKLSLPQSIKDSMIENNNSDVYKKLSVNGFKDYITAFLARLVINALAFVITFIVILILLWLICITLDIIGKLPVLKQVNKLAGLLFGLAHGLVIIWIFFVILTVLQSTDIGRQAMGMITDNKFLSLIYDNNILMGFITNSTRLIL